MKPLNIATMLLKVTIVISTAVIIGSCTIRVAYDVIGPLV